MWFKNFCKSFQNIMHYVFIFMAELVSEKKKIYRDPTNTHVIK